MASDFVKEKLKGYSQISDKILCLEDCGNQTFFVTTVSSAGKMSERAPDRGKSFSWCSGSSQWPLVVAQAIRTPAACQPSWTTAPTGLRDIYFKGENLLKNRN